MSPPNWAQGCELCGLLAYCPSSPIPLTQGPSAFAPPPGHPSVPVFRDPGRGPRDHGERVVPTLSSSYRLSPVCMPGLEDPWAALAGGQGCAVCGVLKTGQRGAGSISSWGCKERVP